MKKALTLFFYVVFLITPVSAQDIMTAVRKGDGELVKVLAAQDASLVNAKDKSGIMPLHAAAAAGSAPMVELLITLGATIDSVSSAGRAPLHEAIMAGKPEAALALIAKGADVRKVGDGMGRTPLHMAAMGDVAAVVGPLVAKGADPNVKDLQGLTPLACAVLWSPGSGVVRALLDGGADMYAKSGRGSSVLSLAISGYQNAAANVELLLDRGISYEPDRAVPMLQTAAAGAALPLFKKLVDKHGDALFTDARSNRATMTRAVLGGSADIVRMLLARGIPIDSAPDADGLNLLHRVAAIPKAAGLIELLVRNGLDIDARTTAGHSAYNLAEAERDGAARRILESLGASREPQRFPELKGPYLGQAPPAGDPIPFARGIVVNNHGVVTVSPDGGEMYWSSSNMPGFSTSRGRVFVALLRDGRWTAPAIAPFSGPADAAWADDSPVVAPDNKRLFFASTRPLLPGGPSTPRLWFVERTGDGWSSPQPLGPEINAVWQFSLSQTGSIYFSDGATTDIFVSRYEGGAYSPPVSLGAPVNSGEVEVAPFIAPDESYLIFSRASGPDAGYHISYRLKDGAWSSPIPLRQLRQAQPTSFVTRDGKYVFFGYEFGFWVPAAFIEELRPKEGK